MPSYVQDPARVDYRNFNICPHCEWWGKEPTLHRMSESMPMISRSDGRTFHLLLADRPLPYPIEGDTGPAQKLSICFWYSYVGGRSLTESTVVLVPGIARRTLGLFRQIEFIADLLSVELLQRQNLAAFYELQNNALQEIGY